MDVGKGGAKRANHLFKTFAPLLLARKEVEFHEINSHQIVRPLKVTLINDFLNKAGDNCFVLRGLHGIPLSDLCNSVNRLVAQGHGTGSDKEPPQIRSPDITLPNSKRFWLVCGLGHEITRLV
jgi:hypothetical protein